MFYPHNTVAPGTARTGCTRVQLVGGGAHKPSVPMLHSRGIPSEAGGGGDSESITQAEVAGA